MLATCIIFLSNFNLPNFSEAPFLLPSITSSPPAWVRRIEIGLSKWSDNSSEIETPMFACYPLKTIKLSKKELPKAQDQVWWCPDYNKQACYLCSSHQKVIKGQMRSVRHFCSVCYKNDKVKLEHPKASSACPYFQKRLESQDNIAAETGTIPCSDIQNILSVSFDSPVDELELIKFFKTCRKFIESQHYNFECCKIPLRTKLNIPFFQFMLADYEDAAVVELLQYGFPIGFSGKLNKSLVPSRITQRGHRIPKWGS